MNKKFREILILIQVILAVSGSLYYWWFGDIYLDFTNWTLFWDLNGFNPCQMCRFARICMYPILPISLIWLYKRSSEYMNYIIALAIPGFLLEAYQYYFQMTNTKEVVKSVICGVGWWTSCAATDVMYAWFITIPFLCLVAFTVILISAYFVKKANRVLN